MTRKEVIETLKMENDLICFNPLTGEDIPLECVNDLNRTCYDAHLEAIRIIKNSIPIWWIDSYCTDCDIGFRDNDAKAIKKLFKDWREENGED